MKITEKELFDFVFNPELLSESKKNFLTQSGPFKDELKFLGELKLSFTNKNRDELFDKFLQKLASEISYKVNELYPKEIKVNKNIVYRLSAASLDLNKKTETITFIDKDSRFLVKLLRREGKSSLYVFDVNHNLNRKVRITIYPTMETYLMENLHFPLEFNDLSEVDMIHLEVIN